MSYTALYRKFRPTTFDEVKGQDHIVTTLRNQVISGRMTHAYLFCGTRGTGKTSVAKLLAKAVNCEHPVNGSPCNECAMCKAINNQSSMNVIEIDAASNNGVDNIREIVDEVQYSPTEGRYKVYIIDEVHMLSVGAFNALLKTLEEPPAYVIFILATTEVHKIPITILSRCQRYDFHRITMDTIANLLTDLMQKEKVEVEPAAIRYVAKAADGSLRDALSLLDQCIAFHFGKTLTYENVLDVLGAVDQEVFEQMFLRIHKQDVTACIELLEQIITSGRELGQFIVDFTWYFRNLLLLKNSSQTPDALGVSSETFERLTNQSKEIDVDTIIRYIRILSDLSNQIKYASQKRVLVEIALVKLCRPSMETNLDSVLSRLSLLEEKVQNGYVISEQKQPVIQQSYPVSSNKEEIEQKPLEMAVPEDLKEVAKNWRRIINQTSQALRIYLGNAVVSTTEEGSLMLVFHDELDRAFVEMDEHRAELETVIENQIHKQVRVRTVYLDENDTNNNNYMDLTKFIKMDVEYED